MTFSNADRAATMLGESLRAAVLVLAAGAAVTGCGTPDLSLRPSQFADATTAIPVATNPSSSGSPAPGQTCNVAIVASGTYVADVNGDPTNAAPRRNGAKGDGIDIDVFLQGTLDGRSVPILFSIWDADSSAGPEPTRILFGAADGSSVLIDRGETPEMGEAHIEDRGGAASFDVHLRLGTSLRGTITCPPLPAT